MGYYIRKRLPQRHPMTATAPNAIKVVVRSHWQTMVLAIAVVMGSTVTSYVMVYFMPTFLIRMANLPASTGFAVTFCSAFGTVYAIGAAVFGGSAQFIVTWLIAITGTPLSAGVYVTGCVLLGALALIFLKEPTGMSQAAMTLSAP